MRDLAVLLLHLLATVARLAGPRGARSVVAESVLVKHQLLILNRSRKRSPTLRSSDRVVAGLCALFMRPGRLVRSAIVFKPSTLLSPFVERLIGTIRRECLDRMLFWTAADLEVKLLDFQRYFNGHRAHAGLGGLTPEPRTGQDSTRASVRRYRWRLHCRGLYQTPIAVGPVWDAGSGQVRTSRSVDRLSARRVLVPD